MKKSDVALAIFKLEKALESLREGVENSKDELDKDGTIQRFEFTFELLWKTLKIYLEFLGVEANNPRASIKEAFKIGIIKDDEIFLDMLEDRNLASHIYNKETSNQIFERIKEVYFNSIKSLIKDLKEKVGI